MITIKNKSFQDIQSNATYICCVFYLDEKKYYSIINSNFFDFSFRSSVKFNNVQGCRFENCGFSCELQLNMCNKQLKKLPNEIGQLKNLTQ